MDDFRALVERMQRMPDQLHEGHFRQKYQPVAHIAYGWLTRCSRTADAIVVLHDAGFDGEVPPLARCLLEHVVALRWLVAVGDEISAPLRSVHGHETIKFLEALRKTASGQFDEEQFAKILASTEHDDHGRDHFHAFAHRARLYGREEDLTSYHALVMESHATYQSAVQYWDPETKETLVTSRADYDWLEFATCYLYRALFAYSEIFMAPPWRNELNDVKQHLITLNPAVRAELDD
ncbi:hypothetical protein A20C1_00245 [marine actinobacterium PHSC20C1]|nr:hypothetical protein A20C1_00245 [marine actinobacterium PHSC20C1]